MQALESVKYEILLCNGGSLYGFKKIIDLSC